MATAKLSTSMSWICPFFRIRPVSAPVPTSTAPPPGGPARPITLGGNVYGNASPRRVTAGREDDVGDLGIGGGDRHGALERLDGLGDAIVGIVPLVRYAHNQAGTERRVNRRPGIAREARVAATRDRSDADGHARPGEGAIAGVSRKPHGTGVASFSGVARVLVRRTIHPEARFSASASRDVDDGRRIRNGRGLARVERAGQPRAREVRLGRRRHDLHRADLGGLERGVEPDRRLDRRRDEIRHRRRRARGPASFDRYSPSDAITCGNTVTVRLPSAS